VPAAHRRRQHYTTSGVLGWGVAAAIGTKMGLPQKEVWCLTGDGSFNFGCQALWSAARYEVPIGVVIFNNGQYQANRQNQSLYRGRMYQTGKYVGVNLGHPDIDHVKIAGGYGVEGERVTFPLCSSLSFDLTVTSIYPPLLTGGTIRVFRDPGRGAVLEEIFRSGEVDVVKLTPSHLALIRDLDNRGSRVRRLVVGGEALERDLAERVRESFAGRVEIYNEYTTS